MHRRLRRLLIFVLCLELQAGARADASNMRFQAIPDPSSALIPVEIQEGTSVIIPPGWRFFPANPNGDLPTGQGDFAVSLDPMTGNILESYREGDVEVREPLVITRDEYNQILTQRNVRRLWRDKTRLTRSVARNQSHPGGIFRVELPVQFPKVVRSIVGDGAPNIEVSGSESISLAGTSDWTASNRIQTEHKSQSAFPSLEMKQELNVNLTGSIGDKIKIDVDQSSNVQTSIDNKVKLRYEGDEDDMIRSVELGNTNLSVEGASFRQEGLFGIKTAAKLGNVDLVTIASKQQGKTETARFTPSGDAKRVQIRDLDYIHRQYFLLADHPVNLNTTTLRIYKDDRVGTNNTTTVQGVARLKPDSVGTGIDAGSNPEEQGNFAQLVAGTDYTIIYPWLLDGAPPDVKIPVLKLQYALGENEVLAVAYEDRTTNPPSPIGTYTDEQYAQSNATLGKADSTLLLKMIKPPIEVFKSDTTGTTRLYDVKAPWYPTTFYELKNFYDLGGRDIALETLSLRIKRIFLGEGSDKEATAGGKALIVVLGLDQKGLAGSADPNAPDGKVDNQFIVDPQGGILFFPDLHPFDPFDPNFTFPGQVCPTGQSGFSCLEDTTRNILRRDSADQVTESNPLVYYIKHPDPTQDARFYIEADFKSSQQGFNLGRFDILEGSETVKVDGIPKRRGEDYNIDYAAGQLTFIKPPGADQTVTVDYSFSPGVGATQLTLLGGSATYAPGPNFSLTSSLIYDNRGAQEKYPKLGEEPAQTLIGDLGSLVTFHPVWMTGLANVIPGVHTNAASLLNIQGHVATSIPNPNTAGEGYIDDMEGNRESNTASLSRTQWFWSSVPLYDMGDPVKPPIQPLVATHNRLQWYNARNVKEGDLKPVLSQAEGGQNEHTVLELNVIPPTGQAIIQTSDWTGITQSLSTSGQDFSKLKYLELWVNDFTPDHTGTHAKLHIDFGRVSEDAFWSPDSLPNERLDTEDKNGDGKLDRSEDLAVDEDTGLDGLHDVEEPGYDATTNPDPNHDDYNFDSSKSPPDYSQINNQENNGTGETNAHPDTEDLNRDGYPDFQNDYFEATVDLSDTSFVAIDVPKDYANDPNVETPIKAENGWRLFRIPITDAIFKRVNSANWEDIQDMRVWINGLSAPLRIQIGGIELVGNRWLAQAVDSTKASRGVFLLVGSRNNKDDADYTSPYDVGNQSGSTAKRREQSLALHFGGLVDSDSVYAFKTVSGDANGLGWTQYREIRYWIHGEEGVEAQNLRSLARFGPDTVNYYEYSFPVKSGWQNVVVPMERLSALKEQPGSSKIESDPATGEVFRVVGTPSFTRILRITFGATVEGVTTAQSGEIWVNDLRLSDVRRDRGMRQDLTVQANFADVLNMNVSYQNQDEDFFRVGTGTNQGTGLNSLSTGFSTTLQLDRLIPTSGVTLPVRFSMQHASDVPKFRTGSDVTLTDERSALETRERNQQSFDVSYRRSGARHGISRFTLNALSGGLNYTRSGSISTSNIDSTWQFRAAGAYDLPIGGGGFQMGRKMKLNLLPDVVGFTAAWDASRNLQYSRQILEDRDSTDLRSDLLRRILTLGGSTSWTPLSAVFLRVNVGSTRNMLLPQEGALKGKEIDHTQSFELRYSPRWLSILGSPNVTLNGRYHESARPELQILSSDPEGTKNIDNGASARATAAFPLGRLAQKFAPPRAAKAGALSPFLAVRGFFSRLQDIQGTFTYERGSAISRVTGDPGFAFATGFTERIAPDLFRLSNSTFSSSRAYASGANTSFRPVTNFSIDARADHRLTYTDGSLGARRNVALTLPDLQARWSELQRLLGLQGTLTSMNVKAGYNFRRDEAGPEDGLIETRINSTTWQPLLGWDLAWRNGLRASVTTNATQVSNIDERIYGTTTERHSKNTEIRLTKTYPASRGIKFPWNKNRVKLPNDLNLNVAFTAAADRNVTKRPGQEEIPDLDQVRLNLTSGTNYNFTQAISGGFNFGFRQTKDAKTDITTRGLTVGLNAQFRF